MAYRVLITRATHQASELSERLRALGAEPVAIPTIEIAEPVSYAALDAAISNLSAYDWVVFTSANAVERFARRATKLIAEFGERGMPPTLRVAAIGGATAKALQAHGCVSSPDQVLLPPQAVAESLAGALMPHVWRTDGASARFLLVRAEEARDVLPAALREAGAQVTIAPAYRNIVPAASVEALRELFREPERWPDAITFTSSSSARNLVALCEAAGVTLPESVERVSIGPITTHTMIEMGVPPHAVAEEATVHALAEAVMRRLGG